MRSLSNLCLINSPPVLVPETKKDRGWGAGVRAEKTGGGGWGWGLTPLEASIPPGKVLLGSCGQNHRKDRGGKDEALPPSGGNQQMVRVLGRAVITRMEAPGGQRFLSVFTSVVQVP